jgi:basic membrane protein A
LLGLGLSAAAAVAWICGPVEATTEPPAGGRVLLVTGTGGLGDEGFNDAGYAGALRAEEELGIELDVVEPTELAEIEQQYRSAAASGDYLIIVGLGFEQGEPSALVATDYPDQLFATIDAASENPNVQGVLFREEENAFLAGVLAAHLTADGGDLANPEKVIGIVLGVDIPHVRRYAVSYEAGARTVDPEIEVIDGVVGNFDDQGIARDLTLAQTAQGADVVYQVAGGAGLGVFSGAEEAQVYAIGEGLNQNSLHPEFIAASTYKLMGEAVFDAISSAVEGTFEGGTFEYGFADGYLVVDREGSEVVLTPEAEADLAMYEEMLSTGEIVAPFSEEDLDIYLDSLE